ncbi:MAG: tetratricopeptide repeat protein [Alphaproteobacteria bacterium]
MTEDLVALEEFGLALAMAGQGRSAEAAHHYRHALELDPTFTEARYNLANLYLTAGLLDEAEPLYRGIHASEPLFARAECNLGMLLLRRERFAEAVDGLTRALAAEPDLLPARHGLAMALLRLGRTAEAVEQYRLVTLAAPDTLDAREELGLGLRDLDRCEEAAAELRLVAEHRPDDPGTLTNLGNVLVQIGRFEEADRCLRRVCALEPDDARHRSNLGVLRQAEGRLHEAVSEYGHALSLAPDDPDIRFNLATALLGLGEYQRGFAEFESRLQAADSVLNRIDTDAPPWDGRVVEDMSLLLYPEQGFGDAIQFVRYAPVMAALGVRVTLACRPGLMPLFSTLSGVERLVSIDQPLPRCDAHAPLMSLPHLLGTTLDTIPAEVPYLTPDPGLVRRWSSRIDDGRPGLKVGIVWQGTRTANPLARTRSIPLETLARLGRRGVTLYSLQVDQGRDQLDDLVPTPSLVDIGGDIARDGGLFMNTAAVMAGLDLIITIDTAAAHLAGALGRPVWVLLAHAADWRWLVGRDDSPWYPTARLFRQPRHGDWDAVISRMAGELSRFAGGVRK